MKRCIAAILLLWASGLSLAEQKVTKDGIDIHYIVLSTMDLAPDVAAKYGIERGPRKGFMNLSAVDADTVGGGLPIKVTAAVKNLLGQVETIELREVREPPARYSIGSFTFSPEETMRFSFTVEFEDGRRQTIEHEQKMFVEE